MTSPSPSTSSNNWYQTPENSADGLRQGDYLFSLPAPAVAFIEREQFSLEAYAEAEVDFGWQSTNCVILSQSCDIGGSKTDGGTLLLGPVFNLGELKQVNSGLVAPAMLNMIRTGKMPSHYMLNECDISDHEFPISVVDFRRVFTIPLEIAGLFVQKGLKRLHLKSPYSEHLAAAYGRSIMRVGLPSDIPAFPMGEKKFNDFSREFSTMTPSEMAEMIERLRRIQEANSP